MSAPPLAWRLVGSRRQAGLRWNTEAMEVPEIRYAPTASGSVAWQACGPEEAPPLLMVPPLAQHLEMMWDKPAFWRPMMRLASRLRVLQFDKLGTGLSDPIDEPADLDSRVQQLVAVLDAAGVERASVLGMSEGGLTAAAAAARHPDRIDALVLVNTLAGASDLAGVAEFGELPDMSEVLDFWNRFTQRWGTADTMTMTHLAPSVRHDETMRRWIPSYERAAASPLLIGRWVKGALGLDVVAELDDIVAPTMVMHLAGDKVVPVAHGRYLANRIAGARFLEVEGDDHYLWMSADIDDYVTAVHEFLDELGLAAAAPASRSLVRHHWDPYAVLTPGERRCARLAQRGLTNAMIADTLGLSVRTVENNLSRSFTKLGVRSRVELALLGEPDAAAP